MKEEDVVKKGAKDVEVNKKKTSNNSKKPSNDVKSKETSPKKKVATSKTSVSKDIAEKKTTAKKVTAKTTDTKKASDKKNTKTSTTKTVKVDSLEDIFESSAKQIKNENKTKPLAATKTAVKAQSTKATGTSKTKNGTTAKSTAKSSTKSNTTKKEGTAKKISNQVTSSEKSSKIKINSKDKVADTTKTKSTKTEENKKVEKESKTKKEDKTKKIEKNKEDEIIEEVKGIESDNEPEEIDLDVIDKELQNKTTIPDADFKKLIKDSALSIIYFIGVLIFLVFDLFTFGKIANSAFIVVQNVFSFILLGAAIAFFEIAYRKDDTSKCIIGIEALFIGIYTLTIPYICQIFKGTFKNFLLSALVVIVGYYFIKACVVFYKKQNRYLRLQENFTVEEGDNEFNLDDEDDD